MKGSLEPLQCMDFRSLRIVGSLMPSYQYRRDLERFVNRKQSCVRLNHTKYTVYDYCLKVDEQVDIMDRYQHILR